VKFEQLADRSLGFAFSKASTHRFEVRHLLFVLSQKFFELRLYEGAARFIGLNIRKIVATPPLPLAIIRRLCGV
jgi:hypothetical protein